MYFACKVTHNCRKTVIKNKKVKEIVFYNHALYRICQTNVLQIEMISFCTFLSYRPFPSIIQHDTSLTKRCIDSRYDFALIKV